MSQPTSLIPGSDPGPGFHTTQWTRIFLARGSSPQARAALNDLCVAYYQPVFFFLRRQAATEEEARDQVQEFFARILEGHRLDGANPAKGRFRSYLLGAVKHLLADLRESARRVKRGGGASIQSLAITQDSTLDLPDNHGIDPDLEFDRQWAMAVLKRALDQLAREKEEQGKTGQWKALEPWLNGEPSESTLTQVSQQLNMEPGAVRTAIHRLRKRFRELVKAEIATTVEDPADIREEMRYLVEVLANPGSGLS